ncbi:unnamed protein product [Miscanthus lutarioriparius]|uniref:RBR-type E3 ubiquitin transferase n=1 Tax=Miscanthus lutarioriparius TaxID=422564 RepID=A0A811NMG8_9POAL|nr:unnamed protein product [Miscanthus lutarioriparius]
MALEREVILFSAFQEMVIQDTSVDSLLDDLFMQDHITEASERPSTSADAGQSSSSIPPPGDEFYCPICMESLPSSRKFVISSCGHAFCVTCIGQYIADKIGENVVHVKCPDPSCGDGTIELADCSGVIPSELFSRWDVALCELTLGEQRLYCPFRDCSAGLVAEDGNGNGAIVEAECPHCHRLFCPRCMVRGRTASAARSFRGSGKTSGAGRT